MATPSEHAKRHHYLPVFYLAEFSDTGERDGALFVVDKEDAKVFVTNPSNVACETHMNTIDLPGLPPDWIERVLDEERYVYALRCAISGTRLDESAISTDLAWFVALLFSRGPTARETLMDEFLGAQPGWLHCGDRHDIRPIFLVETARILYTSLLRGSWTRIVVDQRAEPLITCDFPFHLEFEGGDPTRLYLPLSKRVGLCWQGGRPSDGKTGSTITIGSQWVTELNTLVVGAADRQVYCAPCLTDDEDYLTRLFEECAGPLARSRNAIARLLSGQPAGGSK